MITARPNFGTSTVPEMPAAKPTPIENGTPAVDGVDERRRIDDDHVRRPARTAVAASPLFKAGS